MAAGPRHGFSSTLARGGMLALAAALGLALGCPFELDRKMSCGDGWWDPQFEECDPRDPDESHINACRAQGFDKDASCNPQTCEIRPCDEEVCGDGIVLGGEECEWGVRGGFTNLACTNYESTAIGFNKPYASGTIGSCIKDSCMFGRNDCSFCGDGELDPEYEDIVAPQGLSTIPAEVCDGEVPAALLEDHCESLCIDDPINGDVVVHCDFECADDCSGIAPPDDIIPDPAALGCCVAKDSPCPKFDIEGVPDLPCCSWLENPDWLADEKCVVEETNTIPITFICP